LGKGIQTRDRTTASHHITRKKERISPSLSPVLLPTLIKAKLHLSPEQPGTVMLSLFPTQGGGDIWGPQGKEDLCRQGGNQKKRGYARCVRQVLKGAHRTGAKVRARRITARNPAGEKMSWGDITCPGQKVSSLGEKQSASLKTLRGKGGNEVRASTGGNKSWSTVLPSLPCPVER